MRRNDWLLLAAALMLGGVLFFALRGGGAGVARVYHAGEEVAALPLNEDAEFRWTDGVNSVLVAVGNGRARVVESSCPDGRCVRMGAVSHAGAAIVCLPNRVSVVLENTADKTALDAVLY